MFADEQQEFALIDDAHPIQIQLGDGRAANRCQANHQGEIVAPGEMLVPIVLARVKQWDRFTAERINRRGLVIFVIVTSLAGAREIVSHAFAAHGEWNDVFVGETVRAVIFLAHAIFATALCAFFDQ